MVVLLMVVKFKF